MLEECIKGFKDYKVKFVKVVGRHRSEICKLLNKITVCTYSFVIPRTL